MNIVLALVVLALFSLVLALWIHAVIDASKVADRTERLVWIVVLIAVPGLGLIAWYLIGQHSPRTLR